MSGRKARGRAFFVYGEGQGSMGDWFIDDATSSEIEEDVEKNEGDIHSERGCTYLYKDITQSFVGLTYGGGFAIPDTGWPGHHRHPLPERDRREALLPQPAGGHVRSPRNPGSPWVSAARRSRSASPSSPSASTGTPGLLV